VQLKQIRAMDLPRLPERPIDAHKTSVGSVLVVAGSWGMAGAAYLAAASTLRAGAGYVRVACPDSIYPILAVLLPSAVFVPLRSAPDGGIEPGEAGRIFEASRLSKAVIIGPGLADVRENAEIFGELVAKLSRPMVADAGALNLLAERPELMKRLGRDCILTPHPGEMARLLGATAQEVQGDRTAAVSRLAELTGSVAVLKGARTLVADGARIYENTSGNAGMAKAGTGDVLSGVIGALLVQGLPAFEAAALGVYLHGKAGDAAAREKGRGLLAEDVLAALPRVIRDCDGGRFETGAARKPGG